MLPFPNFVSQLAGIGGGMNRPAFPMQTAPGMAMRPGVQPMPVNSQLMRPAAAAPPVQAMPPVAAPAPAMAAQAMPMQPQNALRRMTGAA